MILDGLVLRRLYRLHRKYQQKKQKFTTMLLPPHSLMRSFTQSHLKKMF